MKTLTKSLKLLITMMLLTCSMIVISCGDDDENGVGNAPENLFGTWSGSSGKRSVTVTFNRDGTGTEEMEFSSSYSRYGMASFTYTFDNNKIKCSGKWADADTEGRTTTKDWTTTFEYHGNSLTGGGFSDVTQLTKE